MVVWNQFFESANCGLYHYAANNPVRYVDPDGREDNDKEYEATVPAFYWRDGPYDLFPKIKQVNTKNEVADFFLSGFAGIYNMAASFVNILSNGVGCSLELYNRAIDWLDITIPCKFTLSGEGVKQDLEIFAMISMTDPQLVAGILGHLSMMPEYLAAKPLIKAEDIILSDKFTKPGYLNQISKRGWNKEMIANTINNPVKITKGYNKYTNNPVTKYYIDDIHYVVQDDVTKKIIQVADMYDPNWK